MRYLSSLPCSELGCDHGTLAIAVAVHDRTGRHLATYERIAISSGIKVLGQVVRSTAFVWVRKRSERKPRKKARLPTS